MHRCAPQVISDLLKPERTNLGIREDRKRGIYVDGLSEWVVRTPEEVRPRHYSAFLASCALQSLPRLGDALISWQCLLQWRTRLMGGLLTNNAGVRLDGAGR